MLNFSLHFIMDVLEKSKPRFWSLSMTFSRSWHQIHLGQSFIGSYREDCLFDLIPRWNLQEMNIALLWDDWMEMTGKGTISSLNKVGMYTTG